MKKVTLLRSLRDLASSKAEKFCSEDRPHFGELLDVYEKIVVDDLVHSAIISENANLVEPVLLAFANEQSDLPIPFEKDGHQITKIRVSGYWLDVSSGDDKWQHLYGEDLVRLYEALDAAGYLDDPK